MKRWRKLAAAAILASGMALGGPGSAAAQTKPGRPKHYVFAYRPPTKAFNLKLSFSKGRASRDEVIDALEGEAFALPVQWLMVTEFAVQDRRQQVGTGAAARERVERCRRLSDRLARPA